MLEWMKAQICVDGVFSITALFKTLLAVVGIVSLLTRPYAIWRRRREGIVAEQTADLAMEPDQDGDTVHILIRNASPTATAKNVVVSMDGVEANRPLGSICPGDSAVSEWWCGNKTQTFNVKVKWLDGNGERERNIQHCHKKWQKTHDGMSPKVVNKPQSRD